MKRAWPLLLVLALPSAPARAAENSSAMLALKKLLEPLQAQRGVSHRWLAVVPLVAPGSAGSAGPVVPAAHLGWKPAPTAAMAGRVTVERTTSKGEETAIGFLPGGTVLRRGTEERLTLNPALLPVTGAVFVDTVAVEPLTKGKGVPLPERGDVRGSATLEMRHTAYLINAPAAFSDLLALEAVALGLRPDAEPVTIGDLNLLAADRRRPAETTLAKLATAYAGEVVGHVLFLGNRAVELVACASPATYASYLAAEEATLSLSMVVWEEIYGLEGPLVKEPDWVALSKEAVRLVKALDDSSIRRESGTDERPAAGETWRVSAPLVRARMPTEIGWLVLDATGRPVALEAWPEGGPPVKRGAKGGGKAGPGGHGGGGGGGPFPPPTSSPGAPPLGQDPTERQSGAMTREFLKRYLERIEKLRAMMRDNTGKEG